MNKIEKEYRCRWCKKIVKESEFLLEKLLSDRECPYCGWVHIFGIDEVDWVSKVVY
jgi:DNA-directed RNA polymerase subunit RPC12/RpoP